MATQRFILAKLIGKENRMEVGLIRSWSKAFTSDGAPMQVRQAVDALVVRLKAQSAAPQTLYYCEWIDRWSMGDAFPETNFIDGHHFSVATMSAAEALLFASRIFMDTQEQHWMVSRLNECASSWSLIVEVPSIVLIREVLGPSVDDGEIKRLQE